MARKEAKLVKKRLRNSYLTTIISISLVLFLLGLLGLLVLNAKRVSDYVKENIGFTLYLSEGAKRGEIIKLQKSLDAKHYVKATSFISREEAARILQQDLGEDFVEFLGYNPLSESIDVRLHADYANPDSLVQIEKEFNDYEEVKEISYQKSLVHLIDDNVRKISIIILIFSGLLFLIALTLINNTIRLSVYSKRFIINTMQLVGATKGFIRRPFLFKSIVHGLYAAVISILLLTGLIYYLQQEIYEVISIQDYNIIAFLFGMGILFGLILSWVSTFFAINKFLRLRTDELYYYH